MKRTFELFKKNKCREGKYFCDISDTEGEKKKKNSTEKEYSWPPVYYFWKVCRRIHLQDVPYSLIIYC